MKTSTATGFFLSCFLIVNMLPASRTGADNFASSTPDVSPTPEIATPLYLDYATFTALTGLVPEVQRPRLAGGTTEAGFQLWAKGQMRIPAAGLFVQGDFAGDCRLEVALLFKGSGQYYLLIAERRGEQWLRRALFPFQTEARLAWDGTILWLGPSLTFVEWEGQEFYLSHSNLDVYAYDYADSDYTGVLLKFTYIGPQDEPYPGLLISSYYRLPSLDIFKPYRRPGVNYANDDAGHFWLLTVSPQQLHRFILAVKNLNSIRKIEMRNGQESRLNFSLSIVDATSANRPNPYEAFLTTDEVSATLHSVGNMLQKDHPAASQLLQEYLTIVEESGIPGKLGECSAIFKVRHRRSARIVGIDCVVIGETPFHHVFPSPFQE